MEIIKDPLLMQQYSNQLKKNGLSIGFVPTMGALHQGHITLIKESQKRCSRTVVSIFVNPIQFGKNEDFDKYPRPEKKDLEILEELKVDALFYPNANTIYPHGFSTYINPGEIGSKLCGKYRDNHFFGVCTVVTKFFNITTCDYAFFGKKDAQQYIIIKKIVKDLNMPLNIIGVKTYRENDGLATSSRNIYLTKSEREKAPLIYQSFKKVAKAISKGENSAKNIKGIIKETVETGFFKSQYIEIVDKNTLEDSKKVDNNTLIAVAFYSLESNTRLIDNFFVEDSL